MNLPLLEYLDKLEAKAKAATQGTWTEVNDWNSIRPDSPLDTIETTRLPRTPGERISWGDTVHVQIATVGPEHDNPDNDRAHILATQPKATLALIAKLRELAILARRAREASTESTISWRELDEALTIEVPE